MVNLYRRGRIAEKKVADYLCDRGYDNIRRSSRSRGPADIYATKDGRKYYIQVKSGSARASSEEIENLRALAKQRRGTAVVIEKNKDKKRWRFFGDWGF